MTPLRVGVCGFGVAGGALAILLSRAGHDVTLLERAPNVGPVGAGFLLQPSGQRVLEALGLLERIVPRAPELSGSKRSTIPESGSPICVTRVPFRRPAPTAFIAACYSRSCIQKLGLQERRLSWL